MVWDRENDDGPTSGGAEEAACALRDQKASSPNRNTFRTLLIPEVEPSLMTNQRRAGVGSTRAERKRIAWYMYEIMQKEN